MDFMNTNKNLLQGIKAYSNELITNFSCFDTRYESIVEEPNFDAKQILTDKTFTLKIHTAIVSVLSLFETRKKALLKDLRCGLISHADYEKKISILYLISEYAISRLEQCKDFELDNGKDLLNAIVFEITRIEEQLQIAENRFFPENE